MLRFFRRSIAVCISLFLILDPSLGSALPPTSHLPINKGAGIQTVFPAQALVAPVLNALHPLLVHAVPWFEMVQNVNTGTHIGTRGTYQPQFDQLHRDLMSRWIHDSETLTLYYEPDTRRRIGSSADSADDRLLQLRMDTLLKSPGSPLGKIQAYQPIRFVLISGQKKVAMEPEFGTNPCALVSQGDEHLWLEAGAGGKGRRVATVYLTKELFRDLSVDLLRTLLVEELSHAIDKRNGLRMPEQYEDNAHRAEWLAEIQLELAQMAQFRSGLSQALTPWSGDSQAVLQRVLHRLPRESVQSAFVRRLNLQSPAYREAFDHHWIPSDPLSGVLYLASGVWSDPEPHHRRFKITRIPGLIRAEVPESLIAYLRNTEGFYASRPKDKTVAVEWQYAPLPGHGGLWIPVELQQFDKGQLEFSALLRVITRPLAPQQPSREMVVRAVTENGFNISYLSHLLGREGEIVPDQMPHRLHDHPTLLWMFGRSPARSPLNRSRIQWPDKVQELALTHIGPQGALLSVDWLGSNERIPLQIAVRKNVFGQITGVLKSRLAFARYDICGLLTPDAPTLWVQGPFAAEGWTGETLYGPHAIYSRAWDPDRSAQGGMPAGKFLNRFEIRSRQKLLDTKETLEDALSRAVLLQSDVVQVELPVHFERNHFFVSLRLPSGNVRINIPSEFTAEIEALWQNIRLPRGLQSEVQIQPGLHGPEPVRMRLGAYNHDDPNRILTRRFIPLLTLDIDRTPRTLRYLAKHQDPHSDLDDWPADLDSFLTTIDTQKHLWSRIWFGAIAFPVLLWSHVPLLGVAGLAAGLAFAATAHYRYSEMPSTPQQNAALRRLAVFGVSWWSEAPTIFWIGLNAVSPKRYRRLRNEFLLSHYSSGERLEGNPTHWPGWRTRARTLTILTMGMWVAMIPAYQFGSVLLPPLLQFIAVEIEKFRIILFAGGFTAPLLNLIGMFVVLAARAAQAVTLMLAPVAIVLFGIHLIHNLWSRYPLHATGVPKRLPVLHFSGEMKCFQVSLEPLLYSYDIADTVFIEDPQVEAALWIDQDDAAHVSLSAQAVRQPQQPRAVIMELARILKRAQQLPMGASQKPDVTDRVAQARFLGAVDRTSLFARRLNESTLEHVIQAVKELFDSTSYSFDSCLRQFERLIHIPLKQWDLNLWNSVLPPMVMELNVHAGVQMGWLVLTNVRKALVAKRVRSFVNLQDTRGHVVLADIDDRVQELMEGPINIRLLDQIILYDSVRLNRSIRAEVSKQRRKRPSKTQRFADVVYAKYLKLPDDRLVRASRDLLLRYSLFLLKIKNSVITNFPDDREEIKEWSTEYFLKQVFPNYQWRGIYEPLMKRIRNSFASYPNVGNEEWIEVMISIRTYLELLFEAPTPMDQQFVLAELLDKVQSEKSIGNADLYIAEIALFAVADYVPSLVPMEDPTENLKDRLDHLTHINPQILWTALAPEGLGEPLVPSDIGQSWTDRLSDRFGSRLMMFGLIGLSSALAMSFGTTGVDAASAPMLGVAFPMMAGLHTSSVARWVYDRLSHRTRQASTLLRSA